MDYGMIGKIEKAKQYAQERKRVTFHSFMVDFKGNNATYELSLGPDGWECTCPGFGKYGICPHLMAMERLFAPMLKREPLPYATGQNVVSDVEKSKQYAEETDRIHFRSFDASFAGNNSEHHTSYQDEHLTCSCSFFKSRDTCSHTMAMERILQKMLPVKVVEQTK